MTRYEKQPHVIGNSDRRTNCLPSGTTARSTDSRAQHTAATANRHTTSARRNGGSHRCAGNFRRALHQRLRMEDDRGAAEIQRH